jgi:hypothetical protein
VEILFHAYSGALKACPRATSVFAKEDLTMAEADALAPIWEFMREHDLTFPEQDVTVSFGGLEAVVEAPIDLVAGGDDDSSG